jgi:antitoxin MazE
MMKTEIKKFGNSKGIIIPANIFNSLNVSVGDEVELKVLNGILTVKPSSVNNEMKQHNIQMQALFNLQKANILKNKDEYSNDYLFAWEHSVYPFFNDTDGSVNQEPHECYEDFFLVTKNHIDWISDYFDSISLQNKPFPSFYNLESELLSYTKQDLKWDRIKLLKACKYLYLGNRFKGEFDEMLKLNSPSEATWIKRN